MHLYLKEKGQRRKDYKDESASGYNKALIPKAKKDLKIFTENPKAKLLLAAGVGFAEIAWPCHLLLR